MDIEIKSEDSSDKRFNNLVAITVVDLRGVHGGGERQGRQHQPGHAEGEIGIGRRLGRIPGRAHQAACGRERAFHPPSGGNLGQLDKALAARQAAEYEADIKKYQERSKETRAKAERLEAEYERLNYRDDQFDLSQAFLSTATALAAIAALVGSRWLLYVAWGSGAYGLAMGVAGFAGLPCRLGFDWRRCWGRRPGDRAREPLPTARSAR